MVWLDFESSVKNGVLGLGELIVWPQAFNTSNMKFCRLVLKTRMKHEWFVFVPAMCTWVPLWEWRTSAGSSIQVNFGPRVARFPGLFDGLSSC